MHTQKTPANELHTLDSPMEPMKGHADIPHPQSTEDALAAVDASLLAGDANNTDFGNFLNQVGDSAIGWISDLF